MSTPPFLVNVFDVVDEPHYLDEPASEYRTRRRLGKATGARRLGVNFCTLRPGQVSSRLHFHSAEEEFFLVLSGNCAMRYGDETHQLKPMDAVSVRPGGRPHQLFNDGSDECVYLAIGVCDEDDRITYPEEG